MVTLSGSPDILNNAFNINPQFMIQIRNMFTGAVILEIESLIGANLSGANLRYADLRYANLRYANLIGANLSDADLIGANLIGANLSGANISGANLRIADLSCADLSGANLRSANLSGANLRSANLSCAKTDKRYVQIGCIGSAKRLTTYCFDDDIIWCGYFVGSLADFEKRVSVEHASTKYLKEYMGFIQYVKSLK